MGLLVQKFHKHFQDFSQYTSLHGYSYLYITSSIAAKLFWIITLILLNVTGILFLASNTQDFLVSRLSTTQSTSDLKVSTFPISMKRYTYTTESRWLIGSISASHAKDPRFNPQSSLAQGFFIKKRI